MQRRQSAGDVHDEHGAIAERAAVRGRPVETAVESLNHTGVRVRAIGTGKVMQGGEGVGRIEREDRAQSVGATAQRGSVDQTVSALNQRGDGVGAIRSAKTVARGERPGGRVNSEDRSASQRRRSLRPPRSVWPYRTSCRRQSRRVLRQGSGCRGGCRIGGELCLRAIRFDSEDIPEHEHPRRAAGGSSVQPPVTCLNHSRSQVIGGRYHCEVACRANPEDLSRLSEKDRSRHVERGSVQATVGTLEQVRHRCAVEDELKERAFERVQGRACARGIHREHGACRPAQGDRLVVP